MPDKAYSSGQRFLLNRILTGALLLVALSTVGAGTGRKDALSQSSAKLDPFNYLPAGAKIKNRHRDVVLADLDGDERQEAIVFYTLGDDPNDHKANILVLTWNGTDYVHFWEDSYDGSWGFAEPTGVYDLNKSGRVQIVAYRTVGASCPGSLEIYEYRKGRIRRITGAWGSKGHCEAVKITDLDGDGVPEIIVSRAHGSNDDIYRWDDGKYVRSNNKFPQKYDKEVEKLLKAIYSTDYVPSSARLMWTIQIVEIFILQHRHSEAIKLCQDVLGIIDNPNLTQPDLTEPKAKAPLYRLLGDTYQASGNLQQAQEQYQKAQSLEAGAK